MLPKRPPTAAFFIFRIKNRGRPAGEAAGDLHNVNHTIILSD